MLRTTSFASLALALGLGAALIAVWAPSAPAAPKKGGQVPLDFAKIYWEYNDSANDLGVHVSLDGEDWRKLKIRNPKGKVIFDVEGKGAYKSLGMTELFFEGAEPSLDEFPLAELLALFPEGPYEFVGKTAGGEDIVGVGHFSHAIPDGPEVEAEVGDDDSVVIRWEEVDAPPAGFPNKPIDVVAYQVIVEDFQVTVPDDVFEVTVSPEYVGSLDPGEIPFEVLAIDASGNQTLTEGTFRL